MSSGLTQHFITSSSHRPVQIDRFVPPATHCPRRVTANFPRGKLDPMTATSLGFGLIGFGAWGRFHADAIAKTTGAELRAIAARSEASRADAKDAFPNAQVYP